MSTLLWLVRREYWENRGGFLWAPFWAGASILLITALGIISAEMTGMNAQISVGVSLQLLMADVTSEQLIAAGRGLDAVQLTFAAICLISMGFVLFFYLLGSLYDDRRDRSVLFWKSLPLSDTQMVLAKVIAATLLAPVLALVLATLAYAVFLLMTMVWAAFHGASMLPALSQAQPMRTLMTLLLMIPLSLLWSLPTVGWLMLCSAWARSKPFLWATLLPLGAWIAVSWLGLIGGSMPYSDSLGPVIARMLTGTWQGGWLFSSAEISPALVLSGDNALAPLQMANMGKVLTTPSMWTGVVAGVAMIAVATWVRGRRIETNG